MTEYLTVKNWEKFQHYKDRNPPWIKLHFEIMTSPDWVMLADASKLLAVVCMLIASRNEGKIPNDPAYFKRVAYLDKAPNFKPLIECGFLIKLLADDTECKQMQADARPETEAYRTDTEKEKNTKKENLEFEEFWKIYPKQRAGNREKAEAAYRQAQKRATPAEILNGLKSYIDSDELKKGFAKGATAWLNDDRWKVDYEVKPAIEKQSIEPEKSIELTAEDEEKQRNWHLKMGIQHKKYNPEGVREFTRLVTANA